MGKPSMVTPHAFSLHLETQTRRILHARIPAIPRPELFPLETDSLSVACIKKELFCELLFCKWTVTFRMLKRFLALFVGLLSPRCLPLDNFGDFMSVFHSGTTP
jgi:hypothetical protein